MKKYILLAAAATLFGGASVSAQPFGNPNRGQQNMGERERGPQQGWPQQGGKEGPNGREGGQRADNQDHPHWSQGDRAPPQYRNQQSAVADWSRFNLRAPPRGQHWVRNDNGDFMRVIIGSGIIAEIANQRMYSSDYRWSQGERLQGGYLQDRYVVRDWRGNRLHRPPYGYRWVHVNDQFLLMAIATGLIAEIALDNR